MGRSTLVIGNGLGMALDSGFFPLSNAIQTVWDDDSRLDQNQKALITQCLKVQGAGNQPCTENDLDILQLAIIACDLLSLVEMKFIGFLLMDVNFPAP